MYRANEAWQHNSRYVRLEERGAKAFTDASAKNESRKENRAMMISCVIVL